MRTIIICILSFLLITLIVIINGCDDVPKSSTSSSFIALDTISTLSEDQVSTIAIVDSAAIKKLKPKFKIKKDEFEGNEWYIPKAAPTYNSSNGIFCYFNGANGNATNLRLKIQYFDDSWLFIKNYLFLIDGKTYTYIPNDVKSDNGSGDIWEWSDDNVSLYAKEIVNALRDAKSVKIKFNGSQYYDTRTVSQAHLKAIKETIELYEAMGGTI